MKRLIIVLPVVFISIAVGFILYRGLSATDEISAEELTVTSGSAGGSEEGAAGSEYGVPGDIYFTEDVESVVFSHQVHAVEMGFDCNTCHANIFQMKAHNAEDQPDFNMDGLGSGKYCGSCHSADGSPAFSTDAQCARCHQGVKGLDRAEQAVQ